MPGNARLKEEMCDESGHGNGDVAVQKESVQEGVFSNGDLYENDKEFETPANEDETVREHSAESFLSS